MKKILLVLIIIAVGTTAYNQGPDTWVQKKDFHGIGRFGAVGFSINNKGYIGMGFTATNQYAKDFWKYDPISNSWSQKADFGGTGRDGAVGFSIGSKGYIGMGYSNNGPREKDFWEYDPISNSWMQKADFAGLSRWYAVGFSIGNYGYIGTGADSNFNFHTDFWQYNPVTDIWTRKADFPGAARFHATGFCIAGKGYLGTGNADFDQYAKDFWEYDPLVDKWTRKADFAGPGRWGAAGFSIGVKGYIGTGYNEVSGQSKDFWEYDPANNLWIKKADFGGDARNLAVGFNINNKGYIGTGGSFLKDFWEYTPEEDTGCLPPTNLNVTSVSDTSAVLKWTLPADIVNGFDIIYHVIASRPVYKRHVTGTTTHIAIGNLQPGTIYRWKIRSDCTTDTTNWIDGPDFTTLSSTASLLNASVKNLNLSNNTVQILPNPNDGNFVIQMQLPSKAAPTTLVLYNNVGTKVWQQNAGVLSGPVSKSINLENKLSPGVYMLMIQNEATTLMQKVVVNK
jgi:hypothetical protein